MLKENKFISSTLNTKLIFGSIFTATVFSSIIFSSSVTFAEQPEIKKNKVENVDIKKVTVPDGLSNTTDFLDTLKSKVKSFTLDNGLKVTLYNRGEAPVFAGVVSVRVGGTDEVEGYTGIAHLLEHMAFKGTDKIGTKDYKREKLLLDEQEKLKLLQMNQTITEAQKIRLNDIESALKDLWIPEDLTKRFEEVGATGLNASTDKELTRYFVSLPKTALELWCKTESERLFKPVLRQFYSEKDVVFEEKRMRYVDSPIGKLYEMLLSTAYTVHPYKNPVIGYEEDLKRLTATDLKNFHDKYYVPNNIAISVVGDMDIQNDFPIIQKYFGSIPKSKEILHTEIIEPEQIKEKYVKLEDKRSPEVFIAYHKPSFPDPRDPVISLLEEMIAGSNTSPMYIDLVNRRKIAVSVDVEEAPGSAYPNLILFFYYPERWCKQ